MKNVLMVIANKDFRDDEYFIPKEILQNNSILVTTVALEPGKAIGAQGGEAVIDATISELLDEQEKWQKYDAAIFIGGSGMASLINEELLQRLAINFNRQKKIIAAICVAPLVLANAGILRGRQATLYPSPEDIDAIVNQGAEYVKEELVIDGNIITAAGPKAAYKFGMALVKKLA